MFWASFEEMNMKSLKYVKLAIDRDKFGQCKICSKYAQYQYKIWVYILWKIGYLLSFLMLCTYVEWIKPSTNFFMQASFY